MTRTEEVFHVQCDDDCPSAPTPHCNPCRAPWDTERDCCSRTGRNDEDAVDLRDAKTALTEPGEISLEAVKARLTGKEGRE